MFYNLCCKSRRIGRSFSERKKEIAVKIKNVDMDSPKLLKSIILYCLPLVFINLIQSVFNSVDMIMLNGFDPDAVAEVGATTSIIHLFVNAFFGISTGVKVVLSHQIGARNEAQVKKTVSTAIITSTALGIVLAVVGIFFAPTFLGWTKCPSDSFAGAELYLKVYMIGVPAIMLYNFASAIITTSGDTQRPLYYMLISGALNVVLNFILLLILPEKVMAVAIATAASQIVGALLALGRLIRTDGICRFDIKHLSFSFSALKKILANGVPIAFSSALMPLSNLQIQTQINELGSAIVAGNSASSSIENLIGSVTNSTVGNAVSVFVGYNIGADRIERVKKSIFYCLTLGAAANIVISVAVLIFSRQLSSLYVTDELAILASQTRLKYNATFYFIACCFSVMSHTVQAFGYSFLATLNSIISVFVFRTVWMIFIYPPHRIIEEPIASMEWIVKCWPISWALLLLLNGSLALYLYFAKLKKGTLKKLT